jgi:N-acylneuraminate cytidylyltransferase
MSGKIGVYEMDEETYFEIDEPSDWLIIENLMSRKNKKDAAKTHTKIKLFATDCDGCLTDGGMYYSESGDELKKFNTLDGMGFVLLREAGIKTAIITGENTQIVRRRADKLKIDSLHMGVSDKLKVLKEISEEMNITLDEIAYMGDDINDVDVLNQVGLGFSVPNATAKAKDAADVIVSVKGGDGAVREAIEYILKYNGEFIIPSLLSCFEILFNEAPFSTVKYTCLLFFVFLLPLIKITLDPKPIINTINKSRTIFFINPTPNSSLLYNILC